MKKASKILLTIGGIFNIIAAISILIAGLVFAIMSFMGSGFVLEFIKQMGGGMGDDMGPEANLALIYSIAAGIGSLFGGAIGFILFLISGVVALKAHKKNVKGSFIGCIVWGVLTESLLLLLGGIFGIIALNKENNQPQPEPAPAPLPEPEPEPAPAPAPVQEEPEPAPAPARKDWFCPNCGAHNEGKFCAACGTKKPE